MKSREAIQKIEQLLHRRRDELRRSLDLARTQLNSTDNGVGDVIDGVVDSENQEITSRLAQAESDELSRIETALRQMQSGEFGICESCQRKIPLARLQAVPYATLCIQCQRSQESAAGTPLPTTHRDNLLLNGNSVELS